MLATDRIAPYRVDTPAQIILPDGRTLPVPDQMTLAEFEKFPWPQGQRWELIWGVPVMTPSPQPPHQDILFELANVIKDALQDRPLKLFWCIDVLLPGKKNYLCPDISVLSTKLDLSRGPVKAVPALVVEGLSPSTGPNDIGPKRDAYAKAGVPEYWVVDPSTNALSIQVDPVDGTYTLLSVAPDGFIHSPTLGRRLKVRRVKGGFEIDVRKG